MSEQLPPADPPAFPTAGPEAAAPPERHPIHLVVTDDLRRSRLTVFFRLLLILPHLVWISLWGIAAFLVLVIAWLVGIFTGRIPDGLHGFLASFIRYGTQLHAYYWIAANPYPGFTGAPGYPVDLVIAPADRQSRLTIFFRGLLVIPASIVSYLLQIVGNILGILAWFYALFTARAAEGLRDLQLYCLRFQAQTMGYVFLLTRRYPSFSGD